MVGNWPAKREGQTTNVSPRISFNPQSNTTVQGASSYCKSVQRTWLLGGEIDDVCILETAPLAMIEATTDTGRPARSSTVSPLLLLLVDAACEGMRSSISTSSKKFKLPPESSE